MRLWTIQPISVLNILNETGEFFAKEEFLDDYFKKSYKWLSEKMIEKIGCPKNKNIRFPIWAWHTRNFQHKKPDLRENLYGEKDEWYVCMEIEIPDNEVVLSDFDAWHFVLNNWYLNTDCYDEETFDKDYEWLNSLSHKEKTKAIKDSWNGIFRIDPYESDWCCRGKYIQATFWCLKKEQVKKIWFRKER